VYNIRCIDQIGTKFGTNQRYFILNIKSQFILINFAEQGMRMTPVLMRNKP